MKHLSLWLHFVIEVAATQKHLTVWSSCPTEETDFSNKLVLVFFFSWNKKRATMPIISQEQISACYHSSCASSHMGEIWLTTMWWSMHRARQWNFGRLKWSSETDSGCTYNWMHCVLFCKIPKIKGWKQGELKIKEWEPISFNLTFF